MHHILGMKSDEASRCSTIIAKKILMIPGEYIDLKNEVILYLEY